LTGISRSFNRFAADVSAVSGKNAWLNEPQNSVPMEVWNGVGTNAHQTRSPIIFFIFFSA
jgi:hypothetical protein